MGFRSTYRPQVGPFRFNTGMKGLTSVTMRMFGTTFRLWSKKQGRGVASVDLPGPISYRPKGRKKNRNDQD
jgi:Protein of unknown function (DUF4236)